jgi:hypothetical protein
LEHFYAIIDDKLEHHPEGVYHLRYAKAGKRMWKPVGTDAYAAITAQIKTEKALAAKAAGVTVVEDGGLDAHVGAISRRPSPITCSMFLAPVLMAGNSETERISRHDDSRTASGYDAASHDYPGGGQTRHASPDSLSLDAHRSDAGDGNRWCTKV